MTFPFKVCIFYCYVFQRETPVRTRYEWLPTRQTFRHFVIHGWTPNIFPSRRLSREGLIKFNTYFPVVGSLSGKGTRNTKSKS